MKEIFSFIAGEIIRSDDDQYEFYEAVDITDDDLINLIELCNEELEQRSSDRAGDL
jgi:hypothetical protein